MAQLSKRERVDAALRGTAVDRVPVSAWRHFIPEERDTAALAEASLHFFRTFDWDWLKVNPRATYYAEAWGNQYNFDDYERVIPRRVAGPFDHPDGLERITPLNPTDDVFGEQLDLLRRIKAGIGNAHFIQTIFSPLSVLAFLVDRPATAPQSPEAQLRQLIAERPQQVHTALAAIAETLAGYTSASVAAGASGIFFAIVRLARQGALTAEEYATFGRPYDSQVLHAVRGAAFNLLHICGPQVYFDLVTDYQVHAINWAAVEQGNPTLATARGLTRHALVGGVDETGVLLHGTAAEVLAAAQAALHSSGEQRLLLTPGCAVSEQVPIENLHALRRAVEPIQATASA